MLHFILVDPHSRTFRTERATYSASLPDWKNIGDPGTLQDLLEQIIPFLDSDTYFEL
jgi:hypothetical protein